MKYCLYCGLQYTEDFSFCQNCNSQLVNDNELRQIQMAWQIQMQAQMQYQYQLYLQQVRQMQMQQLYNRNIRQLVQTPYVNTQTRYTTANSLNAPTGQYAFRAQPDSSKSRQNTLVSVTGQKIKEFFKFDPSDTENNKKRAKALSSVLLIVFAFFLFFGDGIGVTGTSNKSSSSSSTSSNASSREEQILSGFYKSKYTYEVVYSVHVLSMLKKMFQDYDVSIIEKDDGWVRITITGDYYQTPGYAVTLDHGTMVFSYSPKSNHCELISESSNISMLYINYR